VTQCARDEFDHQRSPPLQSPPTPRTPLLFSAGAPAWCRSRGVDPRNQKICPATFCRDKHVDGDERDRSTLRGQRQSSVRCIREQSHQRNRGLQHFSVSGMLRERLSSWGYGATAVSGSGTTVTLRVRQCPTASRKSHGTSNQTSWNGSGPADE